MYYVRIGVQSKHVYGKTSKGYRIYRIERTVFKEWGPVESVRPGGFRWKSPHGGPSARRRKRIGRSRARRRTSRRCEESVTDTTATRNS